MARYAMTPSNNPFQRFSVTVNTQVAERVGYGGKVEDTPTPLDLGTSVANHKLLFKSYWQATRPSNHTRYMVAGGKLYSVEELADGKVKVTRQ